MVKQSETGGIPDRLRLVSKDMGTFDLLDQAAAEIERLRAALTEICRSRIEVRSVIIARDALSGN